MQVFVEVTELQMFHLCLLVWNFSQWCIRSAFNKNEYLMSYQCSFSKKTDEMDGRHIALQTQS